MSSQENQEKEKKSNRGMERSLGTASVFAICTGAMFSSGFFLLPGLAAEEAGTSLPLAYLCASLLILPAIFSMSELSSAIPRAGGPYLFLKRSMGTLMGVIGAFGKYLQLLLKGAFAFVGVGAYLSLVADVSIQPVAIALIAGFTFLNLLGVQQTATTEKLLVAILLLVLAYFIAAGLTEVVEEPTNIKDRFQPLLPFGVEGLFSAVALVFVSYAGIGQIASISEEIKEPSHAIPKGMLLALGVSTILYLSGTFIMFTLISTDNLQGDQAPVATAAAQFTALPLPVMVIVVAALAAFASTGNAAILSAARYPLALARDRLVWSRLGEVDKKGVPKVSVILTGVLLVLLVLAFDVKGIAKLASAFLLFVFLGMCLAVAIFRESRLKEYKPGYRSPLYPWMQIAGVVTYIALIILSGLEAVGFILAICTAGSLWYFFGIREEEQHQSAAIFRLFGRLANRSQATSEASHMQLPMLSDAHFSDVVKRAIVFDLEKEKEYEEVIQHAADALTDHLGGDRAEHAERMKEDVRHWMSPSRAHVAVAPALLHGIEQPEMIVIRGEIHVDDNEYKGLIVLVDDEQSSDRLMGLLSRLNAVIRHNDFPEAWKKAEAPEELKSAFLEQGVRAMTISVDGSGPTASLDGCKVQNVELPEGSLMALIYRQGKLLVPHKDMTLQKGDKITLVADCDAVPQLTERFSLEED
ncbi:amino acid permease [Pontibacter diazotrophicus]|uniref:Amino acid permease n=1 Tax=Pontibacter diazotrophicus TaxID=1400979 RepID=A0A3D8LAT8_9BACT|nr:APC family permease [Pontibacter diazotrophicus]RDV14551.1 amino acid permease [Pontibacter diazotrophicus]